MITSLIDLFGFLKAFFRSRYNLGLEILALRQQLGVLKRKHPRPRLQIHDRIFWILLHRLWPAWSNVLVIVKPETVVAWHRTGFRWFWRLRSRPKSAGRPIINAEVRALIRRMVEENSGWGAPRIHGELLKLGFNVSERTVSRYLRRMSPPSNAGRLWAAFLRNHREVIAAMDFFTVPTVKIHYSGNVTASCWNALGSLNRRQRGRRNLGNRSTIPSGAADASDEQRTES